MTPHSLSWRSAGLQEAVSALLPSQRPTTRANASRRARASDHARDRAKPYEKENIALGLLVFASLVLIASLIPLLGRPLAPTFPALPAIAPCLANESPTNCQTRLEPNYEVIYYPSTNLLQGELSPLHSQGWTHLDHQPQPAS